MNRERIQQKVEKFLQRYSIEGVEKKNYNLMMSECDKLNSKTITELEIKNLELKTKYEYKKNWLSLFVIAIVLSMLANIWSKCFEFINTVIEFASSYETDSVLVTEVGIRLAVIFVFFTTLIILGYLFAYLREMKKIYKESMLVEYVLREKKNHEERTNE